MKKITIFVFLMMSQLVFAEGLGEHAECKACQMIQAAKLASGKTDENTVVKKVDEDVSAQSTKDTAKPSATDENEPKPKKK